METIEKSPPTISNDVDEAAAAATTAAAAAEAANSTKEDNECVVCFKNVDIYSIGECDHPVCYECSTRMRVLCGQNECPICRRVLSKVIFTYDKLPYLELEGKNRSGYYNKRHKISFYTNDIEKAFFNLLDHPCPKCDEPPYRTLHGLRNHVRKQHDMHFCDLCSEHLKIFTFERRCYTQAELGIHRTKGDPDNRSHRGHPLCEYCNKRYLDNDELFKHLRRDHYFCHFCDADGKNDFYRDYDALVAHFRQDHFLCEEGKCATEQFVGAFRTEIDYKAHVASVHGNLLNKQQAKQTRTLQLEITLGPRGRAGHIEPGGANLRSRTGPDEPYDEHIEAAVSQSQRSITIDACNEQDFPSLISGNNGPNLSLTRPPPPSMRNRSAIAGLARTKENFPALGGSSENGSVSSSEQRGSAPPISSVVRKTPTAATGAIPRTSGSGNTTTVIHVSNRPQTANSTNLNVNGIVGSNGKKPLTLDFPALPPGKSTKQQHPLQQQQQQQQHLKQVRALDADIPPGKSTKQQHQQQQQQQQQQHLKQNRALDADMPPLPVPSYMTNVAAKHRTLVDPYVPVEPYTNFQKIQMIHKEEIETKQTRKVTDQSNAPKLTSQDFPSLGGNSAKSTPTWIKPSSEKKQREIENRKSKVAPAPLLPKDNRSNSKIGNAVTTSTSNGNSSNDQNAKKDKKNKDKKSTGEDTANAITLTNKSNNNKTYKEKNNNNINENKMLNANANLINSSQPATLMNGNETSSGNNESASMPLRPPPGFNSTINPTSSGVKPPPGFHSNVTLNSVAKSPNNLTFTSSLGESYSIIPTHSYIQPPDATKRNQKLFGHFKEALNTSEALEEFRHISQKFREGVYKPNAYYEHCQAALKDKFDQIFPELLALLPDISKQQALHLVHTQRLNGLSAQQRNPLPKLEVCTVCKQVLLFGDLVNHRKTHDFPALGAGGGVSGGGGKTNHVTSHSQRK